MSPVELALLPIIVGLIAALVAYVRSSAAAQARQQEQIEQLREFRNTTDRRHDRLEEAIDELTKAVYRLRGDLRVTEARGSAQSGGQFDQGADTDPPTKGRLR